MYRFFLLLIILSAGWKSSEAATLKIEGGYRGYWWGLKLIESNIEDDTIRVYFSDNWKGKPIKIKDLRKGNYIVNLFSIFGDVFIDSLTIDKRTTYEIKTSNYYDYCSDSSLIEQMQVGDTLVGYLERFSCFSWDQEWFYLVKENENTVQPYLWITRDTSYYVPTSEVEFLIKQEKLNKLGRKMVESIAGGGGVHEDYSIRLGNEVTRFTTDLIKL
jgi:hypothetical protein